MIKKLGYLTIIVGLLFALAVLVAIAPYHIYTTTLTEGVNTSFLQLNASPSVMYNGHNVDHFSSGEMIDSNLYFPTHFNNFVLPLPLNHSMLYLIPKIKIEAIGPRLGASFQNSRNVELFEFIIEKPYKFETTLGNQKLFILPIFKNYISNSDSEKLWEDLFLKKLSLPSNEGKSFVESLISLQDVKYFDLVYNLFILYNRRVIIPNDALRIMFEKSNKLGIVELKNDSSQYLKERIFLSEKGYVYPILIKTRKNEKVALDFRSKFINEITFKSSTKDSAIPIYAKYKQLSFNQRLDQQGMAYLYSAWSHDLENKDFVRVIILFLERGKLNLKYLKPFYDYAYKKFGSSLSSASGYLNETPEEALKRKISEELDNEINIETNNKASKNEGQFSNTDEKIKYQLQKAKDKKINVDDDDKMLSIE